MPACVPKLVYNSILSWVAGWYYLIACEIITVGPANYRLPGLGSFLMDAADHGPKLDLAAGLLTLLAVIVLMDAIVWQPLTIWADKFRFEFAASSQTVRSLGMLDALGGIGPAMTRALRFVLVPPYRAIVRVTSAMPRVTIASNPAARRAGRLVRTFLIGR